MPTYPQQKIWERYRKLPEALKEAMGSMAVAEKTLAIGKKFGLTIEKIGFMVDEVGNIILGLERPSSFISTLKNRLEVDENKARNIASEINHQIFFPLREALKNTHQIEVNEETFQKSIQEIIPRPLRAIPEKEPPPAPQKTTVPVPGSILRLSRLQRDENEVAEVLLPGVPQEIKTPPAPPAKPTAEPQSWLKQLSEKPLMPPPSNLPAHQRATGLPAGEWPLQPSVRGSAPRTPHPESDTSGLSRGAPLPAEPKTSDKIAAIPQPKIPPLLPKPETPANPVRNEASNRTKVETKKPTTGLNGFDPYREPIE